MLTCVKIQWNQCIPDVDKYLCGYRFLGSDDQDTYFTPTQRSRIVYEILATTPYGKKKRAEIGIERLLDEGIYKAGYPLHDVSDDGYTVYRQNLFPLYFRTFGPLTWG